MPTTVFRVPSAYTAGQLLYAVRHAREHPDDVYQTSAGDRMTPEEFQRWFRLCLNRKINRGLPPRGRKCAPDGHLSVWERDAKQTAWRVNTPRLIVRESEVMYELRGRLAHRIYRGED